MAGLEGRASLLVRLADALAQNTDIFGQNGRPGNMIGQSAADLSPCVAFC
jgi:hypothetical protein